jgi:hypothetical protein
MSFNEAVLGAFLSYDQRQFVLQPQLGIWTCRNAEPAKPDAGGPSNASHPYAGSTTRGMNRSAGGYLRAMSFKLITIKEGAAIEYGDDAGYRFGENGLLVIEPGDGSQLIFSPSGWLYIEDGDPGSRMNVLSGHNL